MIWKRKVVVGLGFFFFLLVVGCGCHNGGYG